MNRRLAFALGAVAALVVTVIFVTVGDGVSTERGGFFGLVVNHAHTTVWALLTVALGVAALRGRWQRVSGTLAVVALGTYGLFLVTLVLAM